MASIFFRWRDPNCDEKNIEWEAITGEEFYEFGVSGQNQGRHFVKLDNDICPEADTIYIEATKAEYDAWCKDDRHHRYLTDEGKKVVNLSLDRPYGINGNTLYDLLPDSDVDVESEADIYPYPLPCQQEDEMAKKKIIPQYGKAVKNGLEY